MSAGDFTQDLFLSHSSKAKAMVHRLGERMQVSVRQYRKVWLDEWAYAKQEAAKPTSASAFQPLAFSPQPFPPAFGSDWAQLEAGMCGRGNLPFRDPLNQEPHSISLDWKIQTATL